MFYSPIFLFFILIPLFYLLSLSADFVVGKIKNISILAGFNITAMGAILGLFTTLPEMSVAFNSIISGNTDLAFGNLIGGTIVVFSLVLGINLVLNRVVKTDGRTASFIPLSLGLLLPMILGLKGYLGLFDGIFLVLIYLLILRYKLIGEYEFGHKIKFIKLELYSAWREFVSIFFGGFLIVLVSNLIVRVSLLMISEIKVSSLLMGLIVFSIGTNLPEIMVAIRSWKQNTSELSLGHLIGSATANILVIGLVAITKTINLDVNISYYFLLISLSIILLGFLIFYKSDKALTRKEGYILLSFYLFFVIGQSLFASIN